MKHWSEGEVLGILSVRDCVQVTRLCRVLVEDAPAHLFDGGDGAKIKNMVASMNAGGFPALTRKQAEYAGSMLKWERNTRLLDALVDALNRRERAGTAPSFGDPIRPPQEPAQPRAEPTVSVDLVSETAAINSEWGLF